ncbi:allophanate hydrolase [Croceicoccus ponticola]|uniref:Allophanate hydrolase n=1 Tax=Croceicoccus ponticola TaxID=2217664 RepID=A0A437GWB7_9SPHN|nr:allophanate hydrolase [Croceicoccus ponticola]RVQ65137.1 allophanate hydrolase [Croceicoccus ponticola]
MGDAIRNIAQAVNAGQTSARSVMEDAIARIEAYDAVQPQAWISRPGNAALIAMAEAVDRRVATGERLQLAGVPFAVKDNIDVAGLATTAACPDFAYRPEQSATVVAKLEAAGAICVGKTNLDQFATGLNGTRSPYGIPTCVYNRDMVSGGSSSGSGVVVAAGLVPFALGTDTAGSGRVPAAINGCVGFKPSKGRWSTTGLLPACRSIDCISVFTCSVSDAALIDGIVAGFDEDDPYSRCMSDQPRSGPRPVFGIPLADQREFFGDREAEDLFDRAIERCRQLGGEIVEIDIGPLLDAGKMLYGGPYVAERYASVGAFIEGNPDATHPVVASIVKSGLRYDAADTFAAAYVMQDLMRKADGIWAQIDALVLPTTPTCYSIVDMLAEPFGRNARLGHYTSAINLLDMSAIALPVGFRADRTGFGISLIGPAFADEALFDLAERFADGVGGDAPELDMAGGERVLLAVVGAHLHGMPLHWQLDTRGAQLQRKTQTTSAYQLYAMADATPPKPALVHVGAGGTAIEVEVYSLSLEQFGSFVAEVPPPLAIGTLDLDDGTQVKGFVAEARATIDGKNVSSFGSWRAYIQDLSKGGAVTTNATD